MLIHAGRQRDVESAHALVPANHVSDDRRIGVTDVRQPIGVVKRRGQVVLGLCLGGTHSSFSMIVLQVILKRRQAASHHSDSAFMLQNHSKRGDWRCQILARCGKKHFGIGSDGFPKKEGRPPQRTPHQLIFDESLSRGTN